MVIQTYDDVGDIPEKPNRYLLTMLKANALMVYHQRSIERLSGAPAVMKYIKNNNIHMLRSMGLVTGMIGMVVYLVLGQLNPNTRWEIFLLNKKDIILRNGNRFIMPYNSVYRYDGVATPLSTADVEDMVSRSKRICTAEDLIELWEHTHEYISAPMTPVQVAHELIDEGWAKPDVNANLEFIDQMMEPNTDYHSMIYESDIWDRMAINEDTGIMEDNEDFDYGSGYGVQYLMSVVTRMKLFKAFKFILDANPPVGCTSSATGMGRQVSKFGDVFIQ